MRNKPNVQSGLAGTRTEQDLKEALAAEALNYTKYSIYADRAEREGCNGIGRMLKQFADEEKAHAALWMGYLGKLGTTEDNLHDAVCEADLGNAAIYPGAYDNAAEEGFEEIADKLRLTASVEQRQTAELRQTHKSLESGTAFEGDASTVWMCTNCGCTVMGNIPPERCPLCGFRKGCFIKS